MDGRETPRWHDRVPALARHSTRRGRCAGRPQDEHASGLRRHLIEARGGPVSRSQPRHVGPQGRPAQPALPLRLQGRRAHGMGAEDQGDGKVRERGARAHEQQLLELVGQERQAAREAARGVAEVVWLVHSMPFGRFGACFPYPPLIGRSRTMKRLAVRKIGLTMALQAVRVRASRARRSRGIASSAVPRPQASTYTTGGGMTDRNRRGRSIKDGVETEIQLTYAESSDLVDMSESAPGDATGQAYLKWVEADAELARRGGRKSTA